MKKTSLVVFLAIVLFCLAVNNVLAANRWIDDTYSSELSVVLSDSVRDRIYIGDSGNKELIIVDSEQEQIIDRIAVQDRINDLAISKDNKWLAIATDNSILRLDLNKLKTSEFPKPQEIEGAIVSLAYDQDGAIFFVGQNLARNGLVYILNPGFKKIIGSFGNGQELNYQIYRGLIKTDQTGTNLYIAERGLSPVSICKVDISDKNHPVFLAEDAHGELGSNLRDFAVSPRYNQVYVTAGAPYVIQVVDSETMRLVNQLPMQSYPGSVAVTLDGSLICGSNTNPYFSKLYGYDAKTFELDAVYDFIKEVNYSTSQERGLAIERFGEKAFVIHGAYAGYGDKIQVIDLN